MEAPEYKIPVQGSTRTVLPGFRAIRRANPSAIVDVSIVLRRQSADLIGDSIAQMATQLPQERRYLTREQYATTHGADRQDIRRVLQFAARHALGVVGITEAALTVHLRGTIAAMSQAFNVELLVYERHGRDGARRYRGRTGPIYIPAALEGIVQAVLGLDNRPQARPHRRFRSEFGGGWLQPRLVSYTLDRVARQYNFPRGLTGQGQCIGIIALSGRHSPHDLRMHFQQSGVPMPRINSVFVEDVERGMRLGPRGRSSEATSDIEVAGATAAAAHIVVYHARATTRGFFEAVTRAIHDGRNKPSIVAITWGDAEAAWTPQSMGAFDRAFQAAAAMGVTVCCATGDGGSSDGRPGRLAHADFPASSPHVLACGGTSLGPAGEEAVWNDGPGGGASGGGISDFFASPSWQQGAGIPASTNPNRHKGRGVPDVAANAGPMTGYAVHVRRRDTIIGGTGAGCLLWAALLARLNQKLGSSVGFVSSLLYERGLAGCFTDITVGDNDLTGRVGAYRAGPGWDPCTGWGTPDGAKLADALN